MREVWVLELPQMRKWVASRFSRFLIWVRSIWLEGKSWIRWFFQYVLPMGLSWPFKSGWFKLGLGIFFLLLVFSFSLNLEFLNLIARVAESAFTAQFGTESWDAAKEITEWFPAPLALIIVLFFVLASSLWAMPRRTFFEGLATAGLHLVRTGGKRYTFLERMCANQKIILGLGESKRILVAYVERPEEQKIRQILGGERTNHSPKHVIVTAPSTAGKTRTCLELIYTLDPTFAIIWPKGLVLDGNAFARHSRLAINAIIFADDISLNVEEGKPSFHPALQSLLHSSEELVVLATRRSDEIPDEVASAQVVELEEIADQELGHLFSAVAEVENVTQKKVAQRFAGHPGTVVANLDAKREHWRKLPDSCKKILQAEKILVREGVRKITLKRIIGVLEDLWDIQAVHAQLDECLEQLAEQGFMTISKGELAVYPGYRDAVIKLPQTPSNPSPILWEGLRQRADDDAFFEIGYSLDQEQTVEYQISPKKILHRVINAYKESLVYYSPKANLQNKALRQNNLGAAYGKLGKYEEPAKNFNLAVAAFEKSIQLYTPVETPQAYAMSRHNLGIAYAELAKHEEPVSNLKRAIAEIDMALQYNLPEDTPLNYAYSKNSLGVAYRRLSRHKDPSNNLKLSVAAFREALRFLTPQSTPLRFAMTQNNLGNGYRILASHEEPVKNLKRSKLAYKEALRIFSPKTTPLDYAATQNNLGLVLGDLARYEDPKSNLKRAMASLEEALHFYSPQKNPLDYATAQNNLGVTLFELAEHVEPANNLKRAVIAYEEALRFRTPEITPLDYATTQTNMGAAYGALALHKEPKKNLKNAISAFRKALQFRIAETTPLDYANTQTNLGIALAELAKYKESEKNIKLAIISFGKAQGIYLKLLPQKHQKNIFIQELIDEIK